ncbi:carbohydrate kinase family protein [Alkalilimnicola ehrlichii]|uniref:Carbohydrate kinase family protein n=1 Tax=Alkalilimnicola ehrlichii TaxID=351052 RepID=A0A3E0X1D3_9GAMM|nr:carbohydrate kinase family protein [Alkalilimnicola ehrlichii]RFA31265.1 carbohydrate kinase family protein [Alkalilimnicola ehrlichii]RFA39459.1 carbohydrate kinase family protein [Alkalilimnicola ehrlichii]
MTALISGSVAYDTIMVFNDRFRNHILPEQVHILNVSFIVPELRKEFGGCAGNIAYNLKLLGEQPLPMATAGADFEPYAEWLAEQQIPSDFIRVMHDAYTAQAYITTDADDNQITAFHPGAMNEAHRLEVPTDVGAKIGIVAPNGRDGMLQHAAQFKAAGIPFIFDPGQGMPMFDGKDLLDFVEQATWVAVNDYESQLLQERTGLSLGSLAEKVDALIVTLAGEGSQIFTAGRCIDIPAVAPSAVVDPTGCGDAYRAGLLYGLLNDLDWDTTGRIASLMGSIKVAHHGTQNHRFEMDEFRERYREAFGSDF